MPEKWTRGYKPDPAVLELVDNLRIAVETGQIRAIGLVIVTPLLDVEGKTAGDIDGVRKRLLAAGMIEVAHTILTNK